MKYVTPVMQYAMTKGSDIAEPSSVFFEENDLKKAHIFQQ